MKAYYVVFTESVAIAKRVFDKVNESIKDDACFCKFEIEHDDVYTYPETLALGDSVVVLKNGIIRTAIITKVIDGCEYTDGTADVTTLAKIVSYVPLKEHFAEHKKNCELRRIQKALDIKTKLLTDAAPGSDRETQLKAECADLLKMQIAAKKGKTATAANA
jgi:hypothetical protein